MAGIDEVSLEKVVHLLPERELAAYNYWLASNSPAVAPSTQAKFFALYLNGCDCEEIRRLNPGFSLGSIVQAKVSGGWDEKKQEHLTKLLGNVRERVQQVAMESVSFVADMLAAANKLHGDKIKRYIQSGNPDDLGDLAIGSMKAYKEAVEILLKLTGQDKTKVEVGGQVTFTTPNPTLAEARPVTQEEAAKILEGIEVK